MPFYQLYYHLTWSTTQRRPLITSQIEASVHGFLRARGSQLRGTVFAVNGTEDHVHMVTTIPPNLPVSRFVGEIKGLSSALANRKFELPAKFQWQAEYGAFSVSLSKLPLVIQYVERQKEHHLYGSAIPEMELA